MKALFTMRSISFLLLFLTALVSTCKQKDRLSNPTTAHKNKHSTNCILNICFENNPVKTDSIENAWTVPLDDSGSYGHFLQVYNIIREDTSLLIKQCKEKGFVHLPVTGNHSFPVLNEKYIKTNDRGFYKITTYNNEIYVRIEAVNISQKTYILFISNG